MIMENLDFEENKKTLEIEGKNVCFEQNKFIISDYTFGVSFRI